MTEAALKERQYAYGDYLGWPDEERWEIIEGTPFNMTPAPSTRHQEISMELSKQIALFLTGKSCRAYAAPFDIRLPEADEADEAVRNVVQPDIAVICDPDKLDERGCRGAPDFIIEIISPYTAAKDRIKKAALYEKHGVKEYWIVDPFYHMVTVRLLGPDGCWGPSKEHEGKGSLEVETLPGLKIDLEAVFQETAANP